jgi:hypothetical protein
VIFFRIGASDGTLLLGGTAGGSSALAARPIVVAARLNAIAANTSIIIGLIRGPRNVAKRQEDREVIDDRPAPVPQLAVVSRILRKPVSIYVFEFVFPKVARQLITDSGVRIGLPVFEATV